MQLQFTREELKLVAEILEQQAALRTDRLKAASYALLDRVISHDLGLAFDELEDLEEILQSYGKLLQQQLAEAAPETKVLLGERERMLERVKDKVTEACAMV